MICGCALIIDSVLTVAISVASGADAIFSLEFLRPEWKEYKFQAVIGALALLMIMNFRGVKDSVLFLLPIFLLFLVTHAGLILLALMKGSAGGEAAAQATASTLKPLAAFAAVKIILKAYSHGAGTYTGI